MTRKQYRSVLILTCVGIFALALGLILYGFSNSIALYVTPPELLAKTDAGSQRFRLGGMVERGSIVKSDNGHVQFVVMDPAGGDETIKVSYKGALPDLFKEGQGVVTEGVYQPPRDFIADTVLAKHDEKYVPAELVDSLKKRGVWKGDRK